MKHEEITQENIFDKYVDYDKHFHVYMGPSLGNLRDLLKYLPRMTEMQFKHHVNARKNDFAKWVADIHGPGSVSTLIRDADTKEKLIEALHEKVGEYKERLQKRQTKQNVQEVESQEKAGPIPDEKTFHNLKERYTERNEKLQDRFDDVSRHLSEALDDPLPEELEKLIEKLTTRYEELRAKLTEIRKAGKDTFIAALQIRLFPSKLAIAMSTRDQKDFNQAAWYLDQTESELAEVAAATSIDVKKEVMELAGVDEKEYKGKA